MSVKVSVPIRVLVIVAGAESELEAVEVATDRVSRLRDYLMVSGDDPISGITSDGVEVLATESHPCDCCRPRIEPSVAADPLAEWDHDYGDWLDPDAVPEGD